jgi:ABC-type branched-subunit amino acid transport system ATPase component
MTFIGASLIVLAQSAADNTVLSLKNVQVLYDRAIEAVRDVSLDVPAGAIVALLGSNGAGKSTILKAISGVLEQEDGEIVNGGVHLDGAQISGRSPREIVRAGLLQVPEARALFATLTVEENLLMGGFTRARANRRRDLRSAGCAQSRQRVDDFAGRTECAACARGRFLRLHSRERPHCARRPFREAARQRRRAGILSRLLGRTAQEHARCQAL